MTLKQKNEKGGRLPFLKYIILAMLLGLIVISIHGERVSAQSTPLTIPAEGDWVDHGLIFTKGPEGAWDSILWGGFAGCVTKKNGTYYLYYQGSDGYDDIEDTVTNRKIGVATSSNGLNFQKYANNPVVTHAPNNNIEEGAVSCGVSLDGGNMVMYYGANTYAGGSAVHANGIAAESSDGFNFSNSGVALNYADPNLWGNGDEVFPVISFKAPETNQWIVYYIPNGVSQSRTLGVAWGSNRLNLSNSAGVRNPSGSSITTWGMGGGAVSLQDGTYAVFTNDVSTRRMEARIMNPNNPSSFSNPVQTYNFSNFNSGVVYYDTANSTWYLYYRNQDASGYGVKTAVTNQPNPTNQPPSVSAGPDTTVTLQNGTASTTLSGSVSDDGLPNPPGATTSSWQRLSGPAAVSFGKPGSPSTSVTMNTAGTYVLELRVTDGQLSSTDTVSITVQGEPTGSGCHFTSADWNRTQARNGHKMRLTANSAGCTSGEPVQFKIYQLVAGSPGQVLIQTQSGTIANNGQAKADWQAFNNCDEAGVNCPAPGNAAQFYFEVYPVNNPTQVITSAILTVSP